MGLPVLPMPTERQEEMTRDGGIGTEQGHGAGQGPGWPGSSVSRRCLVRKLGRQMPKERQRKSGVLVRQISRWARVERNRWPVVEGEGGGQTASEGWKGNQAEDEGTGEVR